MCLAAEEVALEAAAWVQAVATLVLVGVTIAYVVLTNRMASSAERAAWAAERTMLLDVAPIVFPRRKVESPGVTGSLHNLGGRPAIEVQMRGLLDGVEVFKHSETLIRPTEQKNWMFAYDQTQTGIRANADFSIESTYQSLTGDSFRTVKRYRPGSQHEFEVWHERGSEWRRLSVAGDLDEDLSPG